MGPIPSLPSRFQGPVLGAPYAPGTRAGGVTVPFQIGEFKDYIPEGIQYGLGANYEDLRGWRQSSGEQWGRFFGNIIPNTLAMMIELPVNAISYMAGDTEGVNIGRNPWGDIYRKNNDGSVFDPTDLASYLTTADSAISSVAAFMVPAMGIARAFQGMGLAMGMVGGAEKATRAQRIFQSLTGVKNSLAATRGATAASMAYMEGVQVANQWARAQKPQLVDKLLREGMTQIAAEEEADSRLRTGANRIVAINTLMNTALNWTMFNGVFATPKAMVNNAIRAEARTMAKAGATLEEISTKLGQNLTGPEVQKIMRSVAGNTNMHILGEMFQEGLEEVNNEYAERRGSNLLEKPSTSILQDVTDIGDWFDSAFSEKGIFSFAVGALMGAGNTALFEYAPISKDYVPIMENGVPKYENGKPVMSEEKKWISTVRRNQLGVRSHYGSAVAAFQQEVQSSMNDLSAYKAEKDPIKKAELLDKYFNRNLLHIVESGGAQAWLNTYKKIANLSEKAEPGTVDEIAELETKAKALEASIQSSTDEAATTELKTQLDEVEKQLAVKRDGVSEARLAGFSENETDVAYKAKAEEAIKRLKEAEDIYNRNMSSYGALDQDFGTDFAGYLTSFDLNLASANHRLQDLKQRLKDAKDKGYGQSLPGEEVNNLVAEQEQLISQILELDSDLAVLTNRDQIATEDDRKAVFEKYGLGPAPGIDHMRSIVSQITTKLQELDGRHGAIAEAVTGKKADGTPAIVEPNSPYAKLAEEYQKWQANNPGKDYTDFIRQAYSKKIVDPYGVELEKAIAQQEFEIQVAENSRKHLGNRQGFNQFVETVRNEQKRASALNAAFEAAINAEKEAELLQQEAEEALKADAARRAELERRRNALLSTDEATVKAELDAVLTELRTYTGSKYISNFARVIELRLAAARLKNKLDKLQESAATTPVTPSTDPRSVQIEAKVTAGSRWMDAARTVYGDVIADIIEIAAAMQATGRWPGATPINAQIKKALALVDNPTADDKATLAKWVRVAATNWYHMQPAPRLAVLLSLTDPSVKTTVDGILQQFSTLLQSVAKDKTALENLYDVLIENIQSNAKQFTGPDGQSARIFTWKALNDAVKAKTITAAEATTILVSVHEVMVAQTEAAIEQFAQPDIEAVPVVEPPAAPPVTPAETVTEQEEEQEDATVTQQSEQAAVETIAEASAEERQALQEEAEQTAAGDGESGMIRVLINKVSQFLAGIRDGLGKFMGMIKKYLRKIFLVTSLLGSVGTASYMVYDNISIDDVVQYGQRGLVKVGVASADEAILPVDTIVLPVRPAPVDSSYAARMTYTDRVQHVDNNGDKLWTFRNQFVNRNGFVYVAGMNNANTKAMGGTVHYPGVQGIAHFMINTTANDLSDSTRIDVLRTASKQIGYTDDDWVPLMTLGENNRVKVQYFLGKDLKKRVLAKNEVHPVRLRQMSFAEINFDGAVPAPGFKNTVSALPHAVTGEAINSFVFSRGDNGKNMYGRFNGTTAVFIFQDSANGEVLVREVAGSINMIRQAGNDIMKEFGLSADDLTIGVYDAGSYNAKPRGLGNTVHSNQYSGYNPNDMAGSSLMIPEDREDPVGMPGRVMLGLGILGMIRRKRLQGKDFTAEELQYVIDNKDDVQQANAAVTTRSSSTAGEWSVPIVYSDKVLTRESPEFAVDYTEDEEDGALSKHVKEVVREHSSTKTSNANKIQLPTIGYVEALTTQKRRDTFGFPILDKRTWGMYSNAGMIIRENLEAIAKLKPGQPVYLKLDKEYSGPQNFYDEFESEDTDTRLKKRGVRMVNFDTYKVNGKIEGEFNVGNVAVGVYNAETNERIGWYTTHGWVNAKYPNTRNYRNMVPYLQGPGGTVIDNISLQTSVVMGPRQFLADQFNQGNEDARVFTTYEGIMPGTGQIILDYQLNPKGTKVERIAETTSERIKVSPDNVLFGIGMPNSTVKFSTVSEMAFERRNIVTGMLYAVVYDWTNQQVPIPVYSKRNTKNDAEGLIALIDAFITGDQTLKRQLYDATGIMPIEMEDLSDIIRTHFTWLTRPKDDDTSGYHIYLNESSATLHVVTPTAGHRSLNLNRSKRINETTKQAIIELMMHRGKPIVFAREGNTGINSTKGMNVLGYTKRKGFYISRAYNSYNEYAMENTVTAANGTTMTEDGRYIYTANPHLQLSPKMHYQTSPGQSVMVSAGPAEITELPRETTLPTTEEFDITQLDLDIDSGFAAPARDPEGNAITEYARPRKITEEYLTELSILAGNNHNGISVSDMYREYLLQGRETLPEGYNPFRACR